MTDVIGTPGSPAATDHAAGDSPSAILRGLGAVFNVWSRIDSWEGQFLERFCVGSFDRSILQHRSEIKSLFQHGRDPSVGGKPLGPLIGLRGDDVGVRYEVQLFRAAYVDELVPGLRAGVYGSSVTFMPLHSEVNKRPARSALNPDGIPEVVHVEARLYELGPVTFPQYPEVGGTAVDDGARADREKGWLTRTLAPRPGLLEVVDLSR